MVFMLSFYSALSPLQCCLQNSPTEESGLNLWPSNSRQFKYSSNLFILQSFSFEEFYLIRGKRKYHEGEIRDYRSKLFFQILL
jgi:hypothetical protein